MTPGLSDDKVSLDRLTQAFFAALSFDAGQAPAYDTSARSSFARRTAGESAPWPGMTSERADRQLRA